VTTERRKRRRFCLGYFLARSKSRSDSSRPPPSTAAVYAARQNALLSDNQNAPRYPNTLMWTVASKKSGTGNSDDSRIVYRLMPWHVDPRQCKPTGEGQTLPQNDTVTEHNIKDRAYRHTISTYAPLPDPPPAPLEKRSRPPGVRQRHIPQRHSLCERKEGRRPRSAERGGVPAIVTGGGMGGGGEGVGGRCAAP